MYTHIVRALFFAGFLFVLLLGFADSSFAQQRCWYAPSAPSGTCGDGFYGPYNPDPPSNLSQCELSLYNWYEHDVIQTACSALTSMQRSNFGIPSNNTVGTATIWVDSCVSSLQAYQGGCSPPSGGGTASCTQPQVTWSSCSAGTGPFTIAHGASQTYANVTAGYAGSLTASCNNGTPTVTNWSCNAVSLPTLTNPTHSNIAATSATLGATVTSNGGAALTARGTCGGQTPEASTANCVAASGTTVSSFTHSRTGLACGTTYYYRGYATNAAGTGYSSMSEFTTSACPISTYTITFNANGGSGSMSSQTKTQNVALTLSSNTFTRSGYLFRQWATAANGSGTTYADGATYTANAAATLYAQWMNGSISATGCTIASGQSTCTGSVTWSSGNAGTVSVRQGGSQFSTNTSGSNVSRTLTQGTNTFTLLGSSVTIATASATASCAAGTSWNGSSCQVPAPSAPTGLTATAGSCGTNQIALSWSSVSGATTYTLQRATNSTFTSGLTSLYSGSNTSYTDTGLTAGATYYYRVNAANGGGTSAWSTSVNRTAPTACVACSLPWGGTLAHGSSVTAYQSASVTAPATCASQTRTCTNGTLSGSYTNQSCAVAAQTYTITFNANGGSGSMSSQTKTQNVALTLSSNTFTRSGYTFSGWNTSSNGSGTSYANGATYTANAGATLYAQWAVATCSLPWGGSINNGQSVTAYLASSVASPATCTAQTRTCSSGTLSGTYTNQSCVVASASISAAGCTITAGNSSCATAVSWNSTNVSAPTSIRHESTVFSTTVSGTTGASPRTINYGSNNNFYFYKDGVLLGSGTGTASCVSGTEWKNGVCTLAAPEAPTLAVSGPALACSPTATVTLSWASVDTAVSYVVQRSTSASFPGDPDATAVVYVGSGTSYSATLSSGDRYYYRVLASNGETSDWSNTVLVEVPSCAISADPNSIPYGATTTISWSTSNISSCTVTVSGGGDLWTGSNGVRVTSILTAPTFYTLSCGGAPLGGASVQVLATPELVITPRVVESGSRPRIEYVTNEQEGCILSGGGSSQVLEGAGYIDDLVITANTTFTLSCPVGSPVSQSVEVIPSSFES